MKRLTTLLLFLLLPLWGLGGFAQEKLTKEEKARREKNIQAGNPFARFGYKAKVATLSKGKYLEFHDLDSIVVIGTVRWHVNKNQIVGRIVQDSLNPDAQPIGDRAGRWISPDPLSEEFPSWSPYNMCYDNPVKFVDPDGRAVDNEYNINIDTGKRTLVSNKGGDKTDYINFTTGTNDKKLFTDVVNVEHTTVNIKIGGEIGASYSERLPGEIKTTNIIPSRSVGSDPSAEMFFAWASGKVLGNAFSLLFSSGTEIATTGGRLGNAATRTQLGEISTELETRGYTITGGGGKFPEEYLKPLEGGRKGGSYLDITATHPDYPTLRINTVDITKNGLPTARELINATRIRTQIPPGEHLLLIPKR